MITDYSSLFEKNYNLLLFARKKYQLIFVAHENNQFDKENY